MSSSPDSNVHGQSISEKKINQIIQKARKKFSIPAVSVVIMDSDSICTHTFQGVRNVITNDPILPDDYFHIGSCSKSVLAVIAGKMIEEGKLKWDTKFFDIYPELKDESETDYLSITIEDLFLCAAGIKPYTSGTEVFPQIDSNSLNKRYEFARWLIKQPPSSEKKVKDKFSFLYSNAGYTMIALMLERVKGKNWEDLINQTLKNELGLDVKFGWPNRYDEKQPWGHANFQYNEITQEEKITKALKPYPPDDLYRLHELIAPAGDLSMKPIDYAKYTQLHLQGLTGTDNYITGKMYEYIHFSHQGFSLGVANSFFSGKKITGFDGSAGTFYCRSIIVPEDNIALTIMINSGLQKAVDWITMKIAKRYYNWWWKISI